MESRLVALYCHCETAEKMLYCADYVSNGTSVCDVFDSAQYAFLHGQEAIIDMLYLTLIG